MSLDLLDGSNAAHINPNHKSVISLALMPESSGASDSHLLTLPGEVRNKIYELVFDNIHLVLVFDGKNHLTHRVINSKTEKSYAKYRQWYSQPRSDFTISSQKQLVQHFKAVPHKYVKQGNRVPDLRNIFSNTSIASLLLVCHQTHQETFKYLYEKTCFTFHSPKSITQFLNVLKPYYKSSIRHLSLVHSTYGEPRNLANRKWKETHDRKWLEVCTRAAEEMPKLKELSIYLNICDLPLELNLEAIWASPYLMFADRGLDKVSVALRAKGRSCNKNLAACAGVLQKRLLSPEAREMLEKTQQELKRQQELEKILELEKKSKLEKASEKIPQPKNNHGKKGSKKAKKWQKVY
ncbi:MAG: hypothetical protein M1834_006304 [Cirrosporium novae-zelandiae]|nr:MAG: hypothetical protein M1834_006304 [Cirrosporium novae-zelandiae]